MANGSLRTVGRAVADAQGDYQVTVRCRPGTTSLEAQVSTPSAFKASVELTVTSANQVVTWNSVALQAIRTAHTQAPDAARDLAIVQVAVYDAVNGIDRSFSPYAVQVRPTGGASPAAAAAAAAETALAGLFPAQKSMLEQELAATLASVPAGRARDAGLALGTFVAQQVLALRRNDGANTAVGYTPGSGSDSWVPTPPAFAKAVDPQWGQVTPFALTSGSQFRPPPPPTIDSAQFAADVSQVKALGGTDSTERTAAETASAHFWSDLAGTFDPPGHWNQIGEVAAVARRTNLENSARMFALLDIALADAGIAAWNAKYTYNTARPVTIIRDGAQGANPLVTADPSWTPLWATPAFPSYVSGHSTFSAAAAAVLDSVYGKHFAFDDSGDPTENLAPEHFTSFDQAAQAAGMSRIYGGIHYMSDNLAGLQLGTEIGQYVVGHELQPRGARK
jgi:hypothetical protein